MRRRGIAAPGRDQQGEDAGAGEWNTAGSSARAKTTSMIAHDSRRWDLSQDRRACVTVPLRAAVAAS